MPLKGVCPCCAFPMCFPTSGEKIKIGSVFLEGDDMSIYRRTLCIFAFITICMGPFVYAEVITSPNQLSPNFKLINFENIETGGNLLTSMSNPFTIDDITFKSLTGSFSIFDISLSGSWQQDLLVSSKTLFPGGQPNSAISMTFAHPIAEFLLAWGDPNWEGNVLRAYNAEGVLLEEGAVALGAPGGVHAAWIGFKRPTADIAMILVQPANPIPSPDDYVIDNIHYNSATDADGDGVPDDMDECPSSILAPTVVIDDCDSGVPNSPFPSGCSISDDIKLCQAGAKNHGEFVSCTAHYLNGLTSAGVLTFRQKDAIQACAGKARIP